jgi:hypothetical protein
VQDVLKVDECKVCHRIKPLTRTSCCGWICNAGEQRLGCNGTGDAPVAA